MALLLGTPALAAKGDYFDIGTVAAPWLREKTGARAAGFGGAYAARNSSLDTLPYNPSGLAGIQGQVLNMAYHPFIQGSALSSLSWGMGLPNDSAIALSFNYQSFGEVTRVEFNSSGQPVTNGTLSPYNYYLDATYARGFENGLRVGATLRYLGENLIGVKTSTAITGDLGLGWALPLKGLNLGLALTNAFGKLEGYPLPASLVTGAAYQYDLAPGQSIAAAVDVDLPFVDNGAAHTSLGAEYAWKQYTARLGYRIAGRGGAGGISAGGGILFGGASLDYAFQDGGTLGALHQISVSYRFNNNSVSSSKAMPVSPRSFSQSDLDFKKGKQAFKQKDYEPAIRLLEKAVDADPSHAQAYTYLGLSYWRSGDKVRGKAMIDEALRLDPENTKLKAWLNKQSQ